MADYERTRLDRVLDAIHDHVPGKVQGWIEDRAFWKQARAATAEAEERVSKSTAPQIVAWRSEATPGTKEWDKIVRDQEQANRTADLVKKYQDNFDDHHAIASLAAEVLKDPRAIELLGGKEVVDGQIGDAKTEVDIEAMMRRGPQEGDSVTIIREGQWQMDMDGRVESKTSIGQSEDGFHYKIASTDNHTFDREGSWSEAFETRDQAECVAMGKVDPTLAEPGQPDFFDNSIMPVRGPAQSDVPVVNLKDNVDYQQRAAWDQKHNPSSSQAPAETISERAPQSDFWSSLAREGRAIVDQRPPSVGQDQTQSRTLTQ